MPAISLSVALASVGLLVALWLLGFTRDPLRARLQAIAWTLAFAIAGVLQSGRLPWPLLLPLDGMILSVMVLAGFVVVNPKEIGSRYLVRALIVAVVGLMLFWPVLDSLRGGVNPRNLLAFFFLGLGVWSILERTAQQVQVTSLVLLPTFTLASLIWLLRSQDAAMISVPLMTHAGLLAATLIVAILFPARLSSAALVPFVSILVVMQLAAVHFYLHVNPWTLIALCTPYLVLWLRGWLPFLPREPRAEATTLGVLAALPLIYVLT